MNFIELAQSVIEEANKPLSAREIWSIVEEKSLLRKLNSSGKTPEKTIAARLYSAALDDANPSLSSIGQRPKRFYIPGTTPDDLLKVSNEKSDEDLPAPRYKEKDLHSLLTYFIYEHMESYSKTINHSVSSRKSYNQWIHPDMVACWYPRELWKTEAFDLSQTLGENTLGLLSFEIKKELKFSNLRESFFQAVSNSTWANEGYLVAADIDESPEFHSELQRLNNSHGIGIIKLDVEDPDNSEVLYPSEDRDAIDWEMVNKLMVNNDFQDFIRRVKNDLASKEVRKEWYDEILEPEKLIKRLTK